MFNNAILKNFVSKQLEKKAVEQAKEQDMQQQGMPPQQGMAPPQFQTGGPNWNVSPDAIAGVVDGQSYVTPSNVHVQYDDDEIFESIFDERVAQRNAENASVTAANKKARAEWEQDKRDIDKGADMHREFWNVDFPKTDFDTYSEVEAWMKSQDKWKDSTALLEKANAGPNTFPPGANRMTPVNRGGYSQKLWFNSNANLSSIYPAEPSYEALPHDIEYNLSTLPEDVDEGMFRKWIHNYYPEYAAKNEIDVSVPGKGGSDHIKSAWYELGPEYKKADQTLDMPFLPIPEASMDRKLIRREHKPDRPLLKVDQSGMYYDISTGGWKGSKPSDGYEEWEEWMGQNYENLDNGTILKKAKEKAAEEKAARERFEKLPSYSFAHGGSLPKAQIAGDVSSSDHQEFHPFQGYKYGKPPKSIPKVEENSSSNSTFPAPPVMRAHPDSDPSLYSSSPSSESAPPSVDGGMAAYEAILAEEERVKAQAEYDELSQRYSPLPVDRMNSGMAGDANWVWTLPIGMTSAVLRGLSTMFKHGVKPLYNGLLRSSRVPDAIVKRALRNSPNKLDKALNITKHATLDKAWAASKVPQAGYAVSDIYKHGPTPTNTFLAGHAFSGMLWPSVSKKLFKP